MSGRKIIEGLEEALEDSVQRKAERTAALAEMTAQNDADGMYDPEQIEGDREVISGKDLRPLPSPPVRIP